VTNISDIPKNLELSFGEAPWISLVSNEVVTAISLCCKSDSRALSLERIWGERWRWHFLFRVWRQFRRCYFWVKPFWITLLSFTVGKLLVQLSPKFVHHKLMGRCYAIALSSTVLPLTRAVTYKKPNSNCQTGPYHLIVWFSMVLKSVHRKSMPDCSPTKKHVVSVMSNVDNTICYESIKDCYRLGKWTLFKRAYIHVHKMD